MPQKKALIPSGIVAGLIPVLLIAPGYAETERCIAKPGAEAPTGRHWYYTLDRETHRKCWILAAEGLRSRAKSILSEKAVPPRKPQIAVGPALNNTDQDAVVLKYSNAPAAETSSVETTAGTSYRTAGMSTRLADVSNAEELTRSEELLTAGGTIEDIFKALRDAPHAMEATVTGADVVATAPLLDDANVPAKAGTPLRTVLILFAGTLLASGVARLVFKLSGGPPF